MKQKLEIKTASLRLLIVENEAENNANFSKLLKDAGFNNFEFVVDTFRAFEILERDLKTTDMVILSPSITPGAKLDFCHRVRKRREFDNMQILLESKKEEAQKTRTALKYPGIEMIYEPINYINVIAWLRQLAFNHILMKDMRRYREKTDSELDQARQMQQLILPKAEHIDEIEKSLKVKIVSYFETCDITGGDFWGVQKINDEAISFYIIDCTGHGVTAALNTFRLHAVINDIEDSETKLNPSNFLYCLNKRMCGLFPPGQFATVFYGVIDVKNNNLKYAAAAATPAFLIRLGCMEAEMLACEGYLLGIKKNISYETHEISFLKGDKLVLYSDALIENINTKGEMYGEHRLLDSTTKAPECRDGVNLMARIIEQFNTYRDGPLADDLTVNIYTRI